MSSQLSVPYTTSMSLAPTSIMRPSTFGTQFSAASPVSLGDGPTISADSETHSFASVPSASQMTQSPEASAGDEHRITFPIYDKEGRPTEYEFTSGLGITSSGNQEDLPPTTLLIVPTDDLKKTVEADLHSETTVLVEPKTVAKTVSKALALASATVSSGPPALNSTGAEETAQDHKARDACIAGATMVGGSIVLGYMFSKFKKKNT